MISREEAIKFFDFYNDEDCFTEKCIKAHKKAISDMQKLEKIEKLIDDISDYEHEDFEFDIRQIEQIIKL